MSRTLTIILGGGRGTRLYPLTKFRSKPAVPLGGLYRLIDIPISNCINSGLDQIFVLTQFNSASLNSHVTQTYVFDTFRSGFIDVLAAEQTDTEAGWFKGTADAVRQNLWHFNGFDFDYYLILSGDHLYRMDYQKFIDFHEENGAEISIGVYQVTENQASSFGILNVNGDGRITDFVEKPKTKEELNTFKVPKSKINNTDPGNNYLASMGIYIFGREVLHEILDQNKKSDFGGDIIPGLIKHYRVMAYHHKKYWQDIGSIKAFYDANIAVASQKPPFYFHTQESPIYTHLRFLTGSRLQSSKVVDSLISNGCDIKKSEILNSVIGIRSKIEKNCKLDGVVLMGMDCYENLIQLEDNRKKNRPNLGIGENTIIKRAIVDKNARIGNNVKIVNEKNLEDGKGPGYVIKDGIVVIEKNAIIPSATII